MTLHLNAIIACAGHSSIACLPPGCCRDVSGAHVVSIAALCAVVRQVGPVTGAGAATVTSLLSPGMILGCLCSALCQFVIGIFDEARL